MSKSKRAMFADPLLQSLEGRDRRQRLTRFQACGFLNIGTTKLDGWRKAGKIPPAWIKEGRGVFYSIGELLDSVDAALTAKKAAATPVQASHPVVQNRRIRSKQPLITKQQQDEYGLLEPILRGGRPGVRHIFPSGNSWPQVWPPMNGDSCWCPIVTWGLTVAPWI